MSLSVRALDLWLNRQILASSEAQVRHWWTVKVRAKRLLGDVEPREVERLARRILRALRIQTDLRRAA